MSPPRTKYAISAGRSFEDSVNDGVIANPAPEPFGTIDGDSELEMLIEPDTGFDARLAAALAAAESEDVLALVETEKGAEPVGCEFGADWATLEDEFEMLNALEPGLAICEEIVAGEEMPPAILPAVPDMVVGSWLKNVSNSESCAPLFESARVKACLAATNPINNPKSERQRAAIGVINEPNFLCTYSNLMQSGSLGPISPLIFYTFSPSMAGFETCLPGRRRFLV